MRSARRLTLPPAGSSSLASAGCAGGGSFGTGPGAAPGARRLGAVLPALLERVRRATGGRGDEDHFAATPLPRLRPGTQLLPRLPPPGGGLADPLVDLPVLDPPPPPPFRR